MTTYIISELGLSEGEDIGDTLRAINFVSGDTLLIDGKYTFTGKAVKLPDNVLVAGSVEGATIDLPEIQTNQGLFNFEDYGTVRDLNVTSPVIEGGTHSILIQTQDYGTVDNVNFSADAGFSVQTGGEGSKVVNSSFLEGDFGIRTIGYSNELLVENNLFFELDSDGFKSVQNPNGFVQNAWFEGNVSVYPGRDFIDTTGGFANSTIIDNTIIGGFAAIDIKSPLTLNTDLDTFQYANSDILVTQNIFYDNQSAIVLTSTDRTVDGQIAGNPTLNEDNFELYGVTDVVVTGNSFEDVRKALFVKEATGTTFTYNTVDLSENGSVISYAPEYDIPGVPEPVVTLGNDLTELNNGLDYYLSFAEGVGFDEDAFIFVEDEPITEPANVVSNSEGNNWNVRGTDGVDHFEFFDGSDKDMIRDFEQGVDKILLTGIEFTDITEMSSGASNYKFGLVDDSTQFIILQNFDGVLTESDFVVV